ncbi:MAG: hypothetical protein EP333_01870 [Bacteroidetes bacterium]|nr:MAG: hypothetical protein EP333_01870 [Bacteroidota bacterium]
MKDRIKCISVVGLGETGTSVTQLIITEFRNIQLNIVDIRDDINGRVLDLSHAAVGMDNQISLNDRSRFEESDVVFVCAGTRNLAGEPRETMAGKNHELIESVFGNVAFKNEPYIVVISNPVDAMVTWIHRKGLPVKSVIGTGTLLDTWRLKHLLSLRSGLPMDKVRTAVYGEHGDNLVPIWSKTFLDGVRIDEVFGLQDLSALTEELRTMAKKIRETENATKYGVGSVAMFILRSLMQEEPSDTIVSICVDGEVAFGRPVQLSDAGISIQNDLNLEHAEERALAESIKKIQTVVAGS